MLLVALVPLIACIAGLFVYLLASNPKAVEIGRLTFFAGLLAFLLFMGGEQLSIRIGR